METSAASGSGIGRQIADAFRVRAEMGQATLIPYICAGYPTPEKSLELLFRAADAGADVLELGVPFSDPLADGSTIQRATFEALEHGMSVSGTLDILHAFRSERRTPVVLFTYLNPVYRFGVEDFVSAALEAGAQGLLLTDLPAGADPALESRFHGAGLDLIRLLAPTTTGERAPRVADGASGFLYYISRTGVTGAREAIREGLASEVESLRSVIDLPIAVGFGISTPDQAALVAGVADGVVVGSALLDTVRREGTAEAARFLGALRQAMDG